MRSCWPAWRAPVNSPPWRAEHLFALKQALDAFDFCGAQLTECDREIEARLQGFDQGQAY